MPSRFALPQDPKQPESETNIDLTKRYDVYCSRYNHAMVVYRNVLFKGQKTLFATERFDVLSKFLELENANGDRVLISRHGITAICEHGKDPGGEVIGER